jgi:hypothetical protein
MITSMSSGRASAGMRQVQPPRICAEQICRQTWAVLEWHFLTRPYLMDEALAHLEHCVLRLLAEGRESQVKDLACRAVQLKFGPAPDAPAMLN